MSIYSYFYVFSLVDDFLDMSAELAVLAQPSSGNLLSFGIDEGILVILFDV